MRFGKQAVVRRAARLIADERGQDLLEYALLTGLIAVTAVLLGPSFGTRMKAAYETWNTNVHTISVPPAPIP